MIIPLLSLLEAVILQPANAYGLRKQRRSEGLQLSRKLRGKPLELRKEGLLEMEQQPQLPSYSLRPRKALSRILRNPHRNSENVRSISNGCLHIYSMPKGPT